jgi:replicative superfamily II helicase
MAYGVKSEYVNLVQIPNVGRVRAEKLYQAKIRTVDDFVAADPATLSHLMNIKVDKVKESIEAAKTIKLENML